MGEKKKTFLSLKSLVRYLAMTVSHVTGTEPYFTENLVGMVSLGI